MEAPRITCRPSHPVFEALAGSYRREVLRVLGDRGGPVSEAKLIDHLTITDQRAPSTGQPMNWEAIHTHLPLLEEVGLIDWNRDMATVTLASHQAFDDSRFWLLLESEADSLDEALATLANELRRLILTTLRDTFSSLAKEDLARELLRTDETELEPTPNAISAVTVSLNYIHLPALDNANFVEYDTETGQTTYTGHATMEEIFEIIHEPDEHLVDSYDGFFEGLETAYRDLQRKMSGKAKWPHHWRDPSHG